MISNASVKSPISSRILDTAFRLVCRSPALTRRAASRKAMTGRATLRANQNAAKSPMTKISSDTTIPTTTVLRT